MGRLVEWSEITTESKTLEECRQLLKDALHEMIRAYRQQGKEIPPGGALIQQLLLD
ncbi:MAG: type II toxin-antitoxin system HicB family antitoxin [Candidatus Zixiibacteriota bacterium]